MTGWLAKMCSPGKYLLWLFVGISTTLPLQAELPARREWSRPFMGTVFHITLYGSDQEEMEAAVYRAFDRIEELEETFSYYREESELNRLAASADEGPVIVGADHYEVLEASLYWSRITEGSFDCTIRPLVNLWNNRGKEGLLPSREEIGNARLKTGFRNILLNPRLRSVRLLTPGMLLDLGGIAKGFSADKALALLGESGFNSVLIDAGGDLVLGDPPPGEAGWRVKLDNLPQSPTLTLSNTAIATSGDSYKFFEIGGVRYSHIVDPATGMGLTGHRQVTVIAANAAAADALATALAVLPVSRGLELVSALEGTEILIIESGQEDGSQEHHRSSGVPNIPGLTPGN